MLEDVIGDAAALGDAFALIEAPVDTEIDPALPVLFLGLRQRSEPPRHQWADISFAVEGHAIELVGHEGEGNTVARVKSTQDLEQRAAESRVTRRIGGEWRGEVGSCEVAGGRAQRRE